MSKEVSQMFASIAQRYDLANDVLSGGMHRTWRRTLLRYSDIQPGDRVLDLCTGTGDVAFCLQSRVGKLGSVIGVDFVHEMLTLADEKQRRRMKGSPTALPPIRFVHGDAMHIPFPDATFDAATVSFGIRNVDDPFECLREMKRVVRPHGRVIVLEFGQPLVPGFKQAYEFYSRRVMPHIGGLLTGNRAAYEYLPRTSSQFPCGSRFTALMERAGMRVLHTKPLFCGIAYLYVGEPLSANETLN